RGAGLPVGDRPRRALLRPLRPRHLRGHGVLHRRDGGRAQPQQDPAAGPRRLREGSEPGRLRQLSPVPRPRVSSPTTPAAAGGNPGPRAADRGRADGRQGGPGRRRRGIDPAGAWGVAFVAPQTLLFLAFFLIPVVIAVALAFMEVRPTRMTWVGLDNFQRALNDQLFHRALLNTTVFTLVVVVFWLGKALLIAYLLDPMNRGLQTFFKSAFYLPAVTSSIIISLIWLWIFNPTFGLLNAFVGLFGVEP